MTEREYQAVFFDIGGVIVELASIRAGYASFIDELAVEYGLDSDEALEEWKTTLGNHFRERKGTEYRLARDGYAKATASLFDGEPPANWHERLESAVTDALRPESGIVETVSALSSTELQLAVVSDIDTPEAHSMLGTLGIREYFDHFTTSEAVGYTKPDERMFRDALDALDVDPMRTIMIGDRYEHDIVGAADAGIETVAYGEDARGSRADHEIDQLEELLVIVGKSE